MQIPGTIPGFNDTRQYNPFVRTLAATVNYSLNSSTFLEATFGRAQNSLTGCALAQANTGPTFCRNAFPVNDIANLNNAGLGELPFLFPDAGVIDPELLRVRSAEGDQPGDLGRHAHLDAAGVRVGHAHRQRAAEHAVPRLSQRQQDQRHLDQPDQGQRPSHDQVRVLQHAQLQGAAAPGLGRTLTFANDTSNPLDSGFGFANAALGVFSSYNQFSRYVEGSFVYNNTEGYVQDNWKVNGKLTLDYGVRLVHQQPQYRRARAGVELPARQVGLGQAPVLYLAGCAAQPCTGTNRQALDPRTNQLLGPNTAIAIGTLVPGSGNTTNGLFLSGNGIAKTTYTWPTLRAAPRFGAAYDLTGRQQLILRGGAGLFYDRPSGNSIYPQVQNPPTIRNLTVRYGELQTLASGLQTEAAPTLNVFQDPSGAAVHLAVERRHPDDAAVGDRARRRVHRPARLQHRRGGEPQRGGLRLGVPAHEPGSDAELGDAGRGGGAGRPDARVPRLQHASRSRRRAATSPRTRCRCR